MSAYEKPLPVITDQSRRFWDAAKAGRLELPRCDNCGTFHTYFEPWCNVCAHEGVHWEELSGRGKIWANCRFHKVYFPGFKAAVPYNVAIVELANTLLRAIHSTADAATKGRELRKGLASFASGGSGAIAALLAGAGPTNDGTLDARRVAQNLQMQAGTAADHTLRRMLYEYTSFAIFCVGAAAGREREAELSQRLSSDLARLEPR